MDKDSVFDIMLSKITFDGGYTFSGLYEKFVDSDTPDAKIDSLRDEMIDLKLIKKYGTDDSIDLVILDTFGDEIKNSGGWSEHQRRKLVTEVKVELNKQKREIIKEKKEERKFWIPVILTIVGLFFVGTQIYQAYKQDGQQKEIQTLTREKDSLYIVTTAQTLLLKNQDKEMIRIKKVLDSLHKNLKFDKQVKKK